MVCYCLGAGFYSLVHEFLNIQGADDKLGQFLDQGIYATAYHRNILQVSLKSCASLV